MYFSDIHKPACKVSGAKFLTDAGWSELRNPMDTDVPFNLFTDEGRTFLQWTGEPDLRTKMSGRMVMVLLMCRELEEELLADQTQEFFSPCVSFRIVGTPSKIQTNVTEVAFSLEAHSSETSEGDRLSVSEYIAIGICSVLLGLIYVASIFLYLHLRKRNSARALEKGRDNNSIAAVEEGIIKNNPLLSLTHHFGPSESAYSDTNSSDTEIAPDLIQNHDTHITSAMIHSQQSRRCRSSSPYHGYSSSDSYQENSSFEKLPEENVSIVETLDDRPESLRALNGTIRKKLYFNPAYFEPHLLAVSFSKMLLNIIILQYSDFIRNRKSFTALEFLAKIREVIAVAKQKLTTKRYVPTLLNIPEEEINHIDRQFDLARPLSRRSSLISLKRENSRRKSCTGCPGCEPQDFKNARGKLAEFPVLGGCQNCSTSNESKQRSIRKWLEDIPILRVDEQSGPVSLNSIRSPKRIRSPTRSLPPENNPSNRALSPKPASEQGNLKRNKTSRSQICKPKLPPPPAPVQLQQKMIEEGYYDMVPLEAKMNYPPPDMIQQAMEMENQTEVVPRIPTLTKKQMNAVINELTVHKNMLEAANRELAKRASGGYDTDSLEKNKTKGYCTPVEYVEVSSSQASPSLSTALPVDEEITMQNAIFNKQTGSMTLSKLNVDDDEHDYELVVLKNGCLVNKDNLYKFPPELLKSNPQGGYSLVSEVYVNNGYNYGSNPSSPSESNCSTLEKRTLKVRYDGGADKPGKLLIEVDDCLDHYIPVNDSDEFEPDTLDRPNKNAKLTVAKNNEHNEQILLRSKGSFKSQILDINANDSELSNFNRVFGSLREMYEEKRKQAKEKEHFSLESTDIDDAGKLLTLEDRHSKRQRIKTTSSGTVIPPDLIPPPPLDSSPIYERPKPPRKVINLAHHPKNENNGSVDKNSEQIVTPENEYKLCLLQKSKTNGLVTDLIQTEDLILKKNINDQFVFHSTVSHNNNFPLPIKSLYGKDSPKVYFRNKNNGIARKTWHRPEDSGYLSTDSNESKMKTLERNGSETDESLGDGHSESGAESVETHSVFFGRFHRNPTMIHSSSMDSGVMNCEDVQYSSSDSETVSYTTVVPVVPSKNNTMAMR
ncbi:unnamed protein product [Ceutorhynchus assimilis]|uniref:Uncharacterized protein n=1 Tax=Ceutorhynchus assimilis TaxID=467358 RepID=A0A9N9QM03_9CUCU|nr:unnamed protein product [Ceutorhynchus assimilis]